MTRHAAMSQSLCGLVSDGDTGKRRLTSPMSARFDGVSRPHRWCRGAEIVPTAEIITATRETNASSRGRWPQPNCQPVISHAFDCHRPAQAFKILGSSRRSCGWFGRDRGQTSPLDALRSELSRHLYGTADERQKRRWRRGHSQQRQLPHSRQTKRWISSLGRPKFSNRHKRKLLALR